MLDAPVLWERIRSISSLLLDQFGALGLVAGAIGAIQFSFPIKWMRWILVWIFVAYFTFAIGYNTQDSVGYLLPAIMVFAIWIGLAVPSLWQYKLEAPTDWISLDWYPNSQHWSARPRNSQPGRSTTLRINLLAMLNSSCRKHP